MRVKPGTKAWSLLASLAFSLVVWTGCNTEEPAATNPAPGAGAPPAIKPAPPTPPPSTTPPPPATKGDETKKAP